MLTLSGTAAISRFRLEKLLGEIKILVASITAITANFQHFIQHNNEFND